MTPVPKGRENFLWKAITSGNDATHAHSRPFGKLRRSRTQGPLPVPEAAARRCAGATGLCVALGVIRYGGWLDDSNRGAEIFRNYLGKLTHFLVWLLERRYANGRERRGCPGGG